MKHLRLIARYPLDKLDKLLDPIGSYRLVFYVLILVLVWGIVGAFVGRIPFEWYDIALSAFWLAAVCRGVNWGISGWLDIPRNKDSDLISALILALIMTPANSISDYGVLAAAGAIAMASKYILVLGKRHIFNPAALGAVVVGFAFNQYASWWVGSTFMAPVLFVAALLILRKMKRFTLALAFLVVTLGILASDFYNGQSLTELVHLLWLSVIALPTLFFVSVMLPEPLTSPLKRSDYLLYAVIVAVLYSVASLKLTPEQALLVGNVFAFIAAPGKRLELEFAGKQKEADGIYSFKFKRPENFGFTPGQYMEWTLPTSGSDSRGNRRYLTVASSPTEKEMTVTIRLPEPSSSFKKALNSFTKGDEILAGYLAGSFILPKDQSKKLAFIAGGVGITPFRSIIKSLVDNDQQRSAVLLYSVTTPSEFAFKELFKRAEGVGVKTFYSASSPDIGSNWPGSHGVVNKAMIQKTIPDYKKRLFYISGPYGFVQAVRKALLSLGIKNRKIITDYFPGYG